MIIQDPIPLLEEILGKWKNEIGNDYAGYRNHVYRVVHLCFSLHSHLSDDPSRNEEDWNKIIIAAAFHDLGIWSEKTIDYLEPSVQLANEYLTDGQLEQWIPEVSLMIDLHHRFRKYNNEEYPLVEIFRKADLVDFSLGMIKHGIPKSEIKQLQQHFPNAGFHKRLLQLATRQFFRNPFNPLPMMKW